MSQLSSRLYNVPIVSLRTGAQAGTAVSPIINPNNLKIEGWYTVDQFSGDNLVLPVGEIREFTRHGIAVNDHDAMTDPSELVRLQGIIKINYEIIGKTVVTENGRRVGKVSDFSFDTAGMYIQKLYVTPRGLKAITGDERLIARQQIVQITDKAIVVRGTDLKVDFTASVPAAESSATP